MISISVRNKLICLKLNLIDLNSKTIKISTYLQMPKDPHKQNKLLNSSQSPVFIKIKKR